MAWESPGLAEKGIEELLLSLSFGRCKRRATQLHESILLIGHEFEKFVGDPTGDHQHTIANGAIDEEVICRPALDLGKKNLSGVLAGGSEKAPLTDLAHDQHGSVGDAVFRLERVEGSDLMVANFGSDPEVFDLRWVADVLREDHILPFDTASLEVEGDHEGILLVVVRTGCEHQQGD